jgi:hypothetical protein
MIQQNSATCMAMCSAIDGESSSDQVIVWLGS